MSSSRKKGDPPEGPVRAGSAERDELIEVAAAAAHQLKSPLSSVKTIIATLIGGYLGPLEPRQRHLLEKALERCSHGVDLVRDLMKVRTLERITAEALGPVSMREVFDAVVAAHRQAAEERGIELVGELAVGDDEDTTIRGESSLVREAVSVLVDNAIKYTPREGLVVARLSLRRIEGGEEGEPASELARVEVVDTGIGIPPEEYDNVFREFYRAPSAKQLSTEGTGLGLAFAKRVAERFGGGIALRAAHTGGVHAEISFPLDAECAELMRRAEALEPSEAAADSRRVTQHIVVIGGLAGGSKAAARLMRLDPRADVTIVERGRFLAYAGCGLPFYVSGAITDQRALLQTPLGLRRDSSFFHELKHVRALEMTEALRIDREKKQVHTRSLLDGTTRVLPYDKLILSTGTLPRRPSIEGLERAGVYTLHGITDAEAIRTRLRSQRVKDVVIVGAGFLGCQIAEAVSERGSRVTLVEAKDSVLDFVDPQIGLLVRSHLESHGVRVHTRARVKAFLGADSAPSPAASAKAGEGRAASAPVEEVLLEDGRRLPCDFVLLATGLVPEVGLARAAGLELGKSGAIAVGPDMRTNDPDIFAVGDCAESRHRLSGAPLWIPGVATASIGGRVAAANACGGEERYEGQIGTQILKIFDVTVGRTGLSEREARLAGIETISVLVPGPDRAPYMPTAKPILIKLIADRARGRLLGAQAFGEGDVAKRLDVLATALDAELPLDRIAHLNLGHAPAYALAMDNVITAVNVLRNKLEGRLEGITALELHEELEGEAPPLIIDVRLPAEFGTSRLPGSRHMPLGVLRTRLGELPREDPIVLVCSIGLRSYEASLILLDHGFERVRVLDGGLESWPFPAERLI